MINNLNTIQFRIFCVSNCPNACSDSKFLYFLAIYIFVCLKLIIDQFKFVICCISSIMVVRKILHTKGNGVLIIRIQLAHRFSYYITSYSNSKPNNDSCHCITSVSCKYPAENSL